MDNEITDINRPYMTVSCKTIEFALYINRSYLFMFNFQCYINRLI